MIFCTSLVLIVKFSFISNFINLGPLSWCIWMYFFYRQYGKFKELWKLNILEKAEKAEEPEIKLPTSAGSSKKQESSRKTFTFALLTMPKPMTVWITTNCRKFFKRWECQTTWPASWEICVQVKKQQLELDMEQQTGSKPLRNTSKLYIVTLFI